MRITITFDACDERDDEQIDIDLGSHEDHGEAIYKIESNDHSALLRHQVNDGPISLIERAIFKLRRAGLR